MDFAIKVDQEHNTLYLIGKFNFGNIMKAKQQGKEFINGLESVKIDLGEVIQSDSSLLTLLTDWIRLAKSQAKTISFCHIPRHLQDLIRVSGLDTILPIVN